MNIRIVILFPLLILWLPAVEHRAPTGYEVHALDEQGLATNLGSSLEVPTGPVLLGSAWVVHYIIHNHGQSAFRWSYGGDYRSPRPLRVWLEAIAPDGSLAVDPLAHAKVYSEGGMGAAIPVEPLGTSVITVNPRLYVRLDRPGRWTLRMFHDLGMGPVRGDDDPRWASATVDLVMPTEAQARAVLAEHEKQLTADSGAAGERDPLRADFAAMAFPIYLPWLNARARAGSRLVVEGIAEMNTAEAIDCLLDLLSCNPVAPPVAEVTYHQRLNATEPPHPWAAALHALAERLPAPSEERSWTGTGDPRLLATMDVVRRKRTSDAAQALVRHEYVTVRQAAATVIARSGIDPEILLTLIAQSVLSPGRESELPALLTAFRASGAPVPEPGSGSAAAAVWLDHLLWHRERPDGWEDTVADLLAHPAPRVRELALRIVPWDSPRHWTPDLDRLLRDGDEGVSSRAIQCSRYYFDPVLIPALQIAMCRERHPQMAAKIIRNLGGRTAEAEAWIGCLESSIQPSAAWLAVVSLVPVLTDLRIAGAWPNGQEPDLAARQVIAARLRDFLNAHRHKLTRGALKPDDTWPNDLLPPDWYIGLENGERWPALRR